MSGKLLDVTCKFKCDAAIPPYPGSFYQPQQNFMKGIEKNKILLTDSAKLKLSGKALCRNQPQPNAPYFKPCSISLTRWQQTEKKLTLQGHPCLSESSCNTCLHGGTLTPCESVAKTSVTMGSLPKLLIIPSVISTIPMPSFCLGEDFVSPNAMANPNISLPVLGKKGATPLAIEPEEPASEPNSRYVNCLHSNSTPCPDRAACPYYLAEETVNNSSRILNDNFEKEVNRLASYQIEEEKAFKRQIKGIWTKAAHHLICGNEVFLATIEGNSYKNNKTSTLIFGDLVKLANYTTLDNNGHKIDTGFDINDIRNGILLPTGYDAVDEEVFDEGISKAEKQINRRADAYEVMYLMRKQWHEGSHRYKLTKAELSYFKESKNSDLTAFREEGPVPIKNINAAISNYKDGELFPDYESVVKAKIRKLQQKYGRTRCWKKWGEKVVNGKTNRQRLVDDLYAISAEIKDYLDRFKENPQNSYPYYVSSNAVRYAFNIPKTGKIVVIYNNLHGKPCAARYRVENKKGHVIFKGIDDTCSHIMYLEDSQSNKLQFTEFCSNIIHFYVEEGLDFFIPFNGANPQCGGYFTKSFHNIFEKRIDGHINEYAHDIIVFLENNPYQFVPIKATVDFRKQSILAAQVKEE